jgi:putative Mn2+ efflux pump MntP
LAFPKSKKNSFPALELKQAPNPFMLLSVQTNSYGAKMDIATILLIATGLAMDAFAVSIATGITTTKHRQRNALIMASFFGGFQVLMPLIGWSAGLALEELITAIDHWIAFALLFFIGAKMIYDSTKKENLQNTNRLKLRSLLTLSIATSIDSLMVGLSFAFLQTNILIPLIAIGIVAFSLSFAGFIFGSALGQAFGSKIKIIGGLILIGIGAKILLDHLLA